VLDRLAGGTLSADLDALLSSCAQNQPSICA